MSIEFSELMITVSELKLGMHVIRLDRPWSETSFLIQGFVIDDLGIIDDLARQCKFVYIEGRSESLLKSERHTLPRGKNKTVYINKISMENEISKSNSSYDSAKKTVESIMDGIRIGRMIDMNKARTAVNDIVDGILRNKDALAWLTKIKNKDEYTAEHSLNVSILSATFARHLGHDEADIKKIALGGLLHDVGKARVPTEILNKKGRFTDEEYDIMKQHPLLGRNLLMSMSIQDHSSIDIAHCHHERIDGQGYPRKLKETQIPYFAKVVAIVDAYDAITSNRCYDKGRASMEALGIIFKCKGTQFDAELVTEFIQCIGIYPPGSIVELKNGEVGIVIETNDHHRLKPRILLVLDSNKKEQTQKIVNLNSPTITDKSIQICNEIINGTYGVWIEDYLKHGLLLKN